MLAFSTEPPSATDASLQTDAEQLKERVASAETALQKHIAAADATISALNARVDALEGGVAAVSTTDPVTTVNVGETNDPGAQANDSRDKPPRESRDQAYPLKQSTWDSLILLFLPGSDVSPIDSTVATVLFVGSAVIQVLFTVIIIFQATNLEDEQAGDKFHSDALAWRVGIGHHVNNYDPVTNTSLVTRVCTGYGAEIISQAQRDVFSAIDEYLNGNEDSPLGTGYGPLLAFLAVLVWTAGIASELRDNWQFLNAALKLKHGSTACVEKITAMGAKLYALRSLSTSRLIVVVVASMMRFAVAIGLWYAGMLWLTHTIEMNEIILNAVALGFVLEFDELFYQLVPREIDVVLQNLEPLPMNTRRRWCRTFDPRSLSLVILLFVTMATWTATWNEEFIMQLRASRHLFCSGNTNFVYIEDPATHVVNAAMTLPDEDFKSAFKLDTSRPQLFDAVLQRTNLISDANELGSVRHLFNSLEGVQEPLYKPEIVSHVTDLRVRDEAYAINLVACENIDTTTAYKNGMKSATGYDNCSDATQAMGCSALVRTFCPVSCDCDIADSGIFKRSGCTSQCDANYDRDQARREFWAQRATYCQDNPLWNDDNYDGGRVLNFVSELQQHLFDKGYLKNHDDQAVFTDSYRGTFRERYNLTWMVEDIVGVNVTDWVWTALKSETDSCIWALVFDALFETNLCEADLATGFGSLAPFCEATCGVCGSPKVTVEPQWMALYLKQLLGFDVITPSLAKAMTDAVTVNNCNFELASSTTGWTRVFDLQAPQTGQYTIRVTGQNDYDTALSLWSGVSFQVLHTDDDTYGSDPCFKVDLDEFDQILLLVEGFSHPNGNFTITVECPSSPWSDNVQQSEECRVNPGIAGNFFSAVYIDSDINYGVL